MIREFFSPRVTLFFFVLWFACMFANQLWLRMNRKEHRMVFRSARVPIISGIVAAVICVVAVLILDILS